LTAPTRAAAPTAPPLAPLSPSPPVAEAVKLTAALELAACAVAGFTAPSRSYDSDAPAPAVPPPAPFVACPPAPPVTLALAETVAEPKVDSACVVAVANPPAPAAPMSVAPPAPPVALVFAFRMGASAV
jgi:hypothetical protein